MLHFTFCYNILLFVKQIRKIWWSSRRDQSLMNLSCCARVRSSCLWRWEVFYFLCNLWVLFLTREQFLSQTFSNLFSFACHLPYFTASDYLCLFFLGKYFKQVIAKVIGLCGWLLSLEDSRWHWVPASVGGEGASQPENMHKIKVEEEAGVLPQKKDEFKRGFIFS